MQCIACLFGLFTIALIFGVFLAIWTPAGFLFKVKNKKLWFLSSIPVFIIILVAYFFYLYWPTTVYERTFGFPPTEDVTVHNSQDYYFADTGITYLKFTANRETINRIVSRGLIQRSKAIKPCINTNDVPPDWWDPEITTEIEFYEGDFGWQEATQNREQDFASESECLYYNSVTQESYYMFLGID